MSSSDEDSDVEITIGTPDLETDHELAMRIDRQQRDNRDRRRMPPPRPQQPTHHQFERTRMQSRVWRFDDEYTGTPTGIRRSVLPSSTSSPDEKSNCLDEPVCSIVWRNGECVAFWLPSYLYSDGRTKSDDTWQTEYERLNPSVVYNDDTRLASVLAFD